MLKIEQYKADTVDESAACFATDAEIELAERLRHQLEERYLGTSAHGARKDERSSGGR